MRDLPQSFAEHLAEGATTLCWCWRLTRRDGVVLGFTDHDRDLEFAGTTFEAAAGFTASEMKDAVGLGVNNLEVSSAVSSERLNEADLAAGLYDDGQVEVFRVNWQQPESRVLTRTGSLGEIRRAGTAFTAEVRGLAHYLQQPRGRIYQYGCDADVGDARCGVDLLAATYRGAGAVAQTVNDRTFVVSGLGDFTADWFTRGLMTFTSGPAQAQSIEIKSHTIAAGLVTIELWHAVRGPIEPGQSFVVTAGCDKHISTCKAKFANVINFRGFPHMPGNDFVTSYFGSGSS
ncbi:MAG: DUF2163 domain-containing protein [Hyphomicrobiaceae bacterium]|nr:DUF2163 domain-containing protein [Hyphomicrobiaceae bacterium]